jgi:hypothetical protein
MTIGTDQAELISPIPFEDRLLVNQQHYLAHLIRRAVLSGKRELFIPFLQQ